MWEFEPIESFFLGLSAITLGIIAWRYYASLATVWALPRRRRIFWAAWPALCLIPTLIVLNTAADPQVLGHADYITLFMVGAGVWVFGATKLLPLLGIHMRDDVIERGNRAAGFVAGAMMLAGGICYAGANIGLGPTIWTTIIPALLAMGALSAATVIVRAASPVADAVAIDRDIGSGVILAGFILAAALLLGWAVEGDFLDWDDMLEVFGQRGSGLIVLIVAAIVALWIARPRKPRGGDGK